MLLWEGLQAQLSSNCIRVVGKYIHKLISSWLIVWLIFQKKQKGENTFAKIHGIVGIRDQKFQFKNNCSTLYF